MTRFASRSLGAGALALALLSGCYCSHPFDPDAGPDGGPDARGGEPPNAAPDYPWLDKAMFEGEWWYAATVTDVSGEAPNLGRAALTAPFVGAMTVVGDSGAPTLARVRFQIDETVLLAIPSDGDEPVAAFPIEGHRDLGRDGPERPWNERTHVRVDFTRPLVASQGLFGPAMDEGETFVGYDREPMQSVEQTPGFQRVDGDDDPDWRARWAADEGALVSRIAVDAREMWEPRDCDRGACAPIEVGLVHGFARVPSAHGYAAATYSVEQQDWFGMQVVEAQTEGGPTAFRARRRVRSDGRIVLHLDPAYPPHLVRGAFDAVAQWNEAFMAARRAIAGRAAPERPEDVPCQSEDPSAWCYCGDVRAPEVRIGDRCAGRASFFDAPSARGQSAPYDCWIEGPEDVVRPESEDSYGAEHRGFRFMGSECALVLEVDPREPGDLRSSPLRYVDGLQACGVAQPRLDPTSGEIVTSALFIGGGCLDALDDRVDDLWPALRDRYVPARGDDAFVGYYERIGRVPDELWPVPLPIRPPPSLPAGLVDPARRRPAELPTLEEMDPNPLMGASGTPLEAALVQPIVDEAAQALNRDDPLRASRLPSSLGVGSTLEELAVVSPFTLAPVRSLLEREHRDRVLVDHMVFPPRFAHYSASPQRWWARAYVRRTDARVRWRQVLHRAMVARLVGHALGLTANLAGSLDRDHYPDAWFPVGLATGLPERIPFDENRDNVLAPHEASRFRRAYAVARRARASRGLGHVSSSTVLDVHGDLSDLAGVGRYDRAAVAFGYYDLAEVLDVPGGEPRSSRVEENETENDEALRSDTYGRSFWRWYEGGESCAVDADCELTRGSARLLSSQAAFQRCVRARPSIPVPCDGSADCVCSSFDDDVIDYIERAERRFPLPLHDRIRYRVCHGDDEQSALCAMDDAGDSLTSAMAHARDTWREAFPFSHGADPVIESAMGRYGLAALRLYQDLFDRYFNEPAFRRTTAVLGFSDHYLGSQAAFDVLAEMATLPDVGAYAERDGVHRWVADNPDDPLGTLALPLGLGFPHASQDAERRGLRSGVAWDRLIALTLLTQGSLGSDRVGRPLAARFGDLFVYAHDELLAGIAGDVHAWVGPFAALDDMGQTAVRVPERSVENCRDPRTGAFYACRNPGPAGDVAVPIATADDSTRAWAAARAQILLLERAQIVRALGAPPFAVSTCALGAPLPGSSDPICGSGEIPGYAVYRTTTGEDFVAARGSRTDRFAQVGYLLLERSLERRARLDVLEALPAPTPAEQNEAAALRAQLLTTEAQVRLLADLADTLSLDWRPPMEP